MKKKPTAMGYLNGDMTCCGLSEFDGLNRKEFKAAGAIATIAAEGHFLDDLSDRQDSGDAFSHVVFTQMYSRDVTVAAGCKNLNSLIAYIRRNKLGHIVLSVVKVNPNSGNKIKAALFTPDVTGMRKWMKDRGYEAQLAAERSYYRAYWNRNW